MCSVHLNMGTISDPTHIKTILSFSLSAGKHSIGNTLCNSDGSVAQFFHIFHFFRIKWLLQPLPPPPPRENPVESSMLKALLHVPAECLTNEMSPSTWRATEYLLDVCRATDGAHIDIY
jgi:hypothetical protein